MTFTRSLAAIALGTATFAGAMCWSGDLRPTTANGLFSQAEARVGRPLTPVSYAGVARRTTRRAAYVGAAAAPTTVVVAPAPVCTTTYDPYGNVIKTCR